MLQDALYFQSIRLLLRRLLCLKKLSATVNRHKAELPEEASNLSKQGQKQGINPFCEVRRNLPECCKQLAPSRQSVRRGRNDKVGYCTVFFSGSSCNYYSTFFTSFF
jgi:hypothetical protein